MSKLNETTRCFPRSMEEAFEDNVETHKRRQQWEWMEGHKPNSESWQSMAMCFAAGFIVSMVIFVK